MADVRRLSWTSLAATVALVAVGTVAIWSAGSARSEAMFHGMWKSSLAAAAFGFAVYFAFALCDYRRLVSACAVPAYAVSAALLVVVLAVGSSVYGGRRWLWFFQPSEVAKLATLVMLAWLLSRPGERGARRFLLACLVAGAPTALILAEPDLGTALALVPAVVVMVFASGTWRRGLIALVAAGAAAAAAVAGAVFEAERPGTPPERREAILKALPLKPHQLRRVKVFLSPEEDPTGAGYTLKQAKISIGSGGFSGKGLRKGESSHLKYLPQSISMNDFIFCTYAEETGYVGSLALLALFGLLLASGAWTAFAATDLCGRLLALGVTTLVFAHMFVNIAMSVGLVPITGLPLPFISSGRTFLVVVLSGLGLVQSVSIHGRERK